MTSDTGPNPRSDQPGWNDATDAPQGAWGQSFGSAAQPGEPAGHQPYGRGSYGTDPHAPQPPVGGDPYGADPYGGAGAGSPGPDQYRPDPYGPGQQGAGPGQHGADPYGADPYRPDPYRPDPYAPSPAGPAPGADPSDAAQNPAAPSADVLQSPSAPSSAPPAAAGASSGPGRFGPPPTPPRRKSNQGLLVGGIAGGVLALLLVGALIIMVASNGAGSGPLAGGAGEAAAAALKSAAQQMAGTPAATYKGTVNANGTPDNIEVKMTKAGSATGIMTVDGHDVRLLTVNGQTFAKGDKNFWIKLGVRESSAEEVGKNWGKVDDRNATDYQFPSPDTLAQALGRITEGQIRDSVDVNLNGTAVTKITTADTTYYVSKAAPRRIMRIQQSKVGADFVLDLTPIADGELDQLFTELKAQVRKLKGVRDPNVFVAASPQVSFGKRTFSGITIKASVTPTAVSQVKAIRATMNAKMTSGKRNLGGCTGTKIIKPSGTTTMSCVNSTGKWKSWFQWAKTTPGFHRYAARVNVTAFAYANADVNALLSKIDQERSGR